MGMHIDDYSFGRMVINKKTYTSDVIVYPDWVDPSWWRKQGHYLQEEDLADIVAAKPDVLVVGTGSSGVMQVPEKTQQYLSSMGIKVFIDKTDKAVVIFNNQPKNKKVIGAFHLTC